jgi:probable F420-dependent oxidoreductase
VTGISQPNVSRIGLWDYHLSYHPADQVRSWAQELEELGLGSIWVGEASFREPLTLAGMLLAATHQVTVATGIANIWVRDAFAMTAAQLTLCEAYPDRFLLGIGVSHAALIEGHRGHHYSTPLTAMRRYLDDMDKAWDEYRSVKPPARPPRILAALGPRMLELAATRAAGAHTYLVPPEHTKQARQILGPDSLLVPEQAVVLDDEPSRARRLARAHVRRYLPLPNYVANLRRLGFVDSDFANDGSDRLVDALVAHGSPNVVASRVRDHHDAGANHVCLHVLSPVRHQFPIDQWRALLRHGDRS